MNPNQRTLTDEHKRGISLDVRRRRIRDRHQGNVREGRCSDFAGRLGGAVAEELAA